MLRILEIQDRKSVVELLKKLKPHEQTWVLSDLRTKLEIQNFYLDQQGFYTDESVLRISDLWKKILLRVNPEIRVLSPHAAKLHLRHFLREFASKIDLKESSDPSLLKWMKDLAPIYFHPEGYDRLEEWFKTHPEQETRWKDWWLRCRAAFAYFQNEKILLPQWIPSYLQSVGPLHQYWDRDLIVDLGGQLSSVEAGLLQAMSHYREVVVLAPQIEKAQKFSFILKPYEELKSFSQDVKKVPRFPHENEIKTFRFASTLGSLRETTAQVRKWIEAGVKPSQIAILAPEIESLWPALKIHLDTEGILYNRDTVAPLQALSEVQSFMGHLRALNQNLSVRDLELSYYSQSSHPEIVFEKFEALFKNLYDESDYRRHESVVKKIKSDLNLSKSMSMDEFLLRVVQIWNDTDIPGWLEYLFRETLASFESDLHLPWKEWIVFCESCLSKREIVEKPGDPKGILVTNLVSAHFLSVQYRIFLEVSEENLKSQSKKGLSSESSLLLARELGFWLENSDQSSLEFELEWLLQDAGQEDHLHFSGARLNGETQTPASLWIERARGSEKLVSPQTTVLDSQILNFDSTPHARMKEDTGDKNLELLGVWSQSSLSPSAVESFLKCPFIYYARQTLGLKTFPDVDLDQDRRDVGQVVHKLFEKIMQKDLISWSTAELERLVEELRDDFFSHTDDFLWKPQKSKLIKLSKKFIEFEQDWKKNHPRLKRHFMEVKWQKEMHGVLFKGQIDRVDQSESGELIILDYKNSASTLKGSHEWLHEFQLQMLFYIWALENKGAESIQGEVIAALYYVVKNFKRDLGFESIGDWAGFFENSNKKKQKKNREEKQKLMAEFENLIGHVLDRLKKGVISPQPNDEETCESCDWRKVCRAPHLN